MHVWWDQVSFASTQAAANIVWAMARLSRAGSPLQEEAARVAAQKSRELQPEEAAAIVWAVAVQSHSPHQVCLRNHWLHAHGLWRPF